MISASKSVIIKVLTQIAVQLISKYISSAKRKCDLQN